MHLMFTENVNCVQWYKFFILVCIYMFHFMNIFPIMIDNVRYLFMVLCCFVVDFYRSFIWVHSSSWTLQTGCGDVEGPLLRMVLLYS